MERAEEVAYRLVIPNQEVNVALHNQLIAGYTGLEEQRLTLKNALYEAFNQGDLPAIVAAIKRLFASIPWRNFTNNELIDFEGYYASVLYAFFASLNASLIAEDITNYGQMDLSVQLAGYTYVMEIKLDRTTEQTPELTTKQSTANAALKQIIERRYSEKYRQQAGKGLYEVGLVFGAQARNLVQADWRCVA